MFHSLFNPENTFWRWMAGLADILVLSVLWLLCSVPVVTVGAATAALYDACARGMRGGRGDAWRRFFHTFRAELKTGDHCLLPYGKPCCLCCSGCCAGCGLPRWRGCRELPCSGRPIWLRC